MNMEDISSTESDVRQPNKQESLRYYLGRWIIRNSMDEIFPNIYLGGSYAAENIEILLDKKITYVLSIMSKNLPPSTREAYKRNSIDHTFIKKDDERHEDLLSILGDSCSLIEENVQKGKGVLVHCAIGMSRSATVMSAYVMQRWGLSRSDALQFVRSKRTITSPNRGFRKQLDIWGESGYNVFRGIKIDGKQVPKEAYAQWLSKRERKKNVEEPNPEQNEDATETSEGSIRDPDEAATLTNEDANGPRDGP